MTYWNADRKFRVLKVETTLELKWSIYLVQSANRWMELGQPVDPAIRLSFGPQGYTYRT